MFEHRFADGSTALHRLPMMASALAVVDPNRQLLATEAGLFLRDAEGALTLLVEIEAHNPVTRSNDARVHPCGALWMGTMGKEAEPMAGAIYWFFKGETRQL